MLLSVVDGAATRCELRRWTAQSLPRARSDAGRCVLSRPSSLLGTT